MRSRNSNVGTLDPSNVAVIVVVAQDVLFIAIVEVAVFGVNLRRKKDLVAFLM